MHLKPKLKRVGNKVAHPTLAVYKTCLTESPIASLNDNRNVLAMFSILN